MTTYLMKRVYEPAPPDDGYRVLVDRLWPRGESKEKAALDLWAKVVAPSPELRRWFHADRVGRQAEFEDRYRAELRSSGAATELAKQLKDHPVVTLLTGNKDVSASELPVLREELLAAR